ncbi:hypothetical protein JL100_014535 [Skermanella mucosa]|uniref:DUF5672 family protein n=1 Tax=Skermanella mucosa TaxID=1789672 RepID=UPI00192A89A6|nr:DUF5672 family protein [Skermanella mucosa]UEM23903.1 hypothetical protein JL100_014535 [Skermanella mucosa]
MGKGNSGKTSKRDLSVAYGFVEPPDPWPTTGSGGLAVVVPLAVAAPVDDERLSFDRLWRHASGVPRYLVIPEGLELEFDHADFSVVRVPAAAMAGIAAYNRMMITPWFYRLFAGYRHILLYQLDCLLLGEGIGRWCERGWSYVGAPWFGNRGPDDLKSVGNGGFSLRRIDHMLAVLGSDRFYPHFRFAQQRCHFAGWKHLKLLAGGLFRAWTSDGGSLATRFAAGFERPEDEFWSQYAPFFLDRYSLPAPREALGFAFEARPRVAFDLTGGRLPLGCHAWSRMDRAFWLEQLAELEPSAGRIGGGEAAAREREAALP